MKSVFARVLALNVLLLVILVFIFPHLMVSPGKLITGHQSLATDCFACHAPFRGVTAQRCLTCHRPADIGKLKTTGEPLLKPVTARPFHQQLLNLDCMACHSDHAGVKRFHTLRHFSHALLPQDTRQQCQSCHQPPKDELHRQITGNCSQCHTQERWTPASFDHNRYFVLDRDHNVKCAVCHARNDYRRYSCYMCHTPSSIRAEHAEEGIRNLDDCVRCHRSAEGEGEGGESDD